MKKSKTSYYLILGIALFFNLTIHAQNLHFLEGLVVDENNSPLSNVLVTNTINRKFIASTNHSGKFSIQANLNDSIELKHVAYKTELFCMKDFISKKRTVAMTPKVVDLNEVVVSYTNGNRLIEKAIFNLKKNLMYPADITYFLSGTEIEEKTNSQIDSYALYTASMKKTNPKKDKLNYSLQLIDFKSVQVSLDTGIIIDRHLINTEYHLRDLSWKKIEKNYTVIINSEKDDVFEITCYPKSFSKNNKNNATYRYMITKEDTTLFCYEKILNEVAAQGQSKEYLFPSPILNQVRAKLNREYSFVLFKEQNGKYYLEQLSHEIKVAILGADKDAAIGGVVAVSISVKTVPRVEPKQEGMKLGGSSRELFSLPNTTNEDFWKEYMSN